MGFYEVGLRFEGTELLLCIFRTLNAFTKLVFGNQPVNFTQQVACSQPMVQGTSGTRAHYLCLAQKGYCGFNNFLDPFFPW